MQLRPETKLALETRLNDLTQLINEAYRVGNRDIYFTAYRRYFRIERNLPVKLASPKNSITRRRKALR